MYGGRPAHAQAQDEHRLGQQRRLTAHTEVNLLWQQLNVEVFDDKLRDADWKRTHEPSGEVDQEILKLAHTVLGILRQIWIYQSLNEVDQDFWITPAIYWAKRIRKNYAPEWASITAHHRGYDIDFLEKVVMWSHMPDPDPARLKRIADGIAVAAR